MNLDLREAEADTARETAAAEAKRQAEVTLEVRAQEWAGRLVYALGLPEAQAVAAAIGPELEQLAQDQAERAAATAAIQPEAAESRE